jgi:DNA replication protein DnaC
MTPPSGATVDLHDQVIRQNCRMLKTPAIAAQYQGLAEAAAREGHSHVRYLDALLGAEIDERERKAVLRRVKEARLPRLKTLPEFDFAQSPVSAARIADLAAGGYIARAEPVLLIGKPAPGRRIWPPACASPPASSADVCASPPPQPWSTSWSRRGPPTP